MPASPYIGSDTPRPDRFDDSDDLYSVETTMGALLVLGVTEDDARAAIDSLIDASGTELRHGSFTTASGRLYNGWLLTRDQVNIVRRQLGVPEIADYSTPAAREDLAITARTQARHDPDVVRLTALYMASLRHEIETGRAAAEAERVASRAAALHRAAINEVSNTHTELLEAVEAIIPGTDVPPTSDDEQDTGQ